MKRNRLMVATLVVALIVALLSGCAEPKPTSTNGKDTSKPQVKFPEHEVTMVVPWAAGGSADTLARLVSKYAEKYLGKPIVVTNRDGAGGTIATTEVAKAKPDGYTLIFEAVGIYTTQPHVKNVNYKLSDFDGIIGLSRAPILVAARADAPWKNMKELIDDYKSSGKELKYGHPGAGGLPHLAQLDLYRKAGIKAAAVPFNGGAQLLPALLGGNVDVIFGHPSELLPHVKAGKVRLLGVFSGARQSEVPDVPTMKEQVGYETVWEVYQFLMAPKGLPAEVKAKLEDAFKKTMDDPEFKKAMETAQITPLYLSGDELVKRLEKDYTVMGKVISDAGLGKK